MSSINQESPTAAPRVDWNAVAVDPAAASAAASGGYDTLPEAPMSVLLRLPVRYDTRKARIFLPSKYAMVPCAALSANTGVFGNCYVENEDVPHPAVRSASPMRDGGGVIVYFHPERTNGGVEQGPGYDADNPYPGGQIEPRPIDVGVPYVEVEVKVKRTWQCGCKEPSEWGA